MSTLKEKLMSIDLNLIEKTIAEAPVYQIAELLHEYNPIIEEIMTEELRTTIKKIKEERNHNENS